MRMISRNINISLSFAHPIFCLWSLAGAKHSRILKKFCPPYLLAGIATLLIGSVPHDQCSMEKYNQIVMCSRFISRGGSGTAVISKMEHFVIIASGSDVNYYHKALYLACCSSPRSVSDLMD